MKTKYTATDFEKVSDGFGGWYHNSNDKKVLIVERKNMFELWKKNGKEYNIFGKFKNMKSAIENI